MYFAPRSRIALFVAALVTAVVPAGAQTTTVLKLPEKTVEVVGLRRWTVAMIQDSLAKYSPGDSLHHHACAAVLRYKLGFADAAASSYDENGREYMVVSVVEPQDSGRVRYRPAGFDSLGARMEWSEALTVLTRKPRAFHGAVPFYLPHLRDPRTPVPSHLRRDSVDVLRVWRFLGEHRGERDYERALVTVLSDQNLDNRLVAAALLANFPERDPAWWALVEVMREEDGAAKMLAGNVLAKMAEHHPRAVDWAPAAGTVHAMLDGTSLFVLPQLLEVLPKTRIGPEQAESFLAGGGRMVLAHLGAEHPQMRESAHQFLTAVSGQDFGYDVARWRAWVSTLGSPALQSRPN
jgi:hypothetical protein